MIKLNLLPDIKREYLRTRRLEARVISIAIAAIVIAVGLVVAVGLYVYAAQTVHKKLLTDKIAENNKTLKSIKDIDKYVTIQSQLASLDTLHDKKSMYSRLFEILPKLNPKQPNSVTITGINLDASTSTITLEGNTSTFTGLETFRDTLNNAELSYVPSGSDNSDRTKEKLFSQVTVENQTLATVGNSPIPSVSFKITALYAPATFARSSGVVDVTVPEKETTQSKQDTPDVFGGDQ